MHDSVLQFLRERLNGAEIFNRDVIEIGSQDVNGSPREVIAPFGPRTYWGVDFCPGKGVDLVLDVSKISSHFGPSSFDIVVSTETLEHAENWREAITEMKRVLRPGGILIVTARGPGFPYHGFPHDHWRFTVDDFKAIFSDMKIEACLQDTAPGVLFKGVKIESTGSPNLSRIEIQRISVPPEMIQVEGSVDVIVSNWNTLPWLRLLHSQFRRFHPRIQASLFVWDNASTDGSPEWLEKEGIRHYKSPTPFCHADSLHGSIEMTQAPYVAFMDVDAIPVDWWWLDQAVGLLQDEKVGIVGLGAGKVEGHHRRFVHPSFCVFRREVYLRLGLRPHIVHDFHDKKTAFDVGETMCAKLEDAGYRLEFVGDTQLDISQRDSWKNRVVHCLSSTPVLAEKRTDLLFIQMVNSVVGWHRLLLGKLGVWEEFEKYAREAIPRNHLCARYARRTAVPLESIALSIVIPTCGRAHLETTLGSIVDAGISSRDEVIVVADGPQTAAKEICDNFKASLKIHYLETRKTGVFGAHQRNVGMGMAKGSHVLFIDDDDTYRPGALNIVRQALSEFPDDPHLFRIANAGQRHFFDVIWKEKKVILGNVSTQMIALPLVDPFMGTWPSGHCSDYGFLQDTLPRYSEDRIIWREEIIADLR